LLLTETAIIMPSYAIQYHQSLLLVSGALVSRGRRPSCPLASWPSGRRGATAACRLTGVQVLDVTRVSEAIGTDGWALVPDVVDTALLKRLRDDLQVVHEQQRRIQIANGVGDAPTARSIICRSGGAFLTFSSANRSAMSSSTSSAAAHRQHLRRRVESASNLSYVGRIHRDLRSFSGTLPLMAQWLVMLDDFTEENGATHVLSGSHRLADQPGRRGFDRATRAVGPAGSIVVFNSNLWHAAGVNRSKAPRRALTIVFTRPSLKQQLDYPRARIRPGRSSVPGAATAARVQRARPCVARRVVPAAGAPHVPPRSGMR
jgi:ectoine hydroxylase-related dioxygenase (phytanoyl-CoA dioxygenase family)